MLPPDNAGRPDPAPVFSRDAVLGGLPAKRASTLLFAIENRTALVAARARRAIARSETEHSIADRERQFLGALAEGRAGGGRSTIQSLDRHAAEWRDLVPPDVALRAALLIRIAAKYGLPAQARGIAEALGADEPAVAAEYERQGGPPRAMLRATRLPARERLRWLRDRLSRRIESLPPFWLAYALTLTETVGAGVLVLPIALAGFGPLAAIAILVAFGLINTLTIAALVEAITRTGNMRYGLAYFGQLIGDYLGRPGNIAATPVLYGLEAATFVVCIVGLATTIGSLTGIDVVLWGVAFVAVNLVILWRDSLDVTVAVAVALGFVNLGLILAISAIAFASGGATSSPVAGAAGGGMGIGILELVFGVALGAYFGHTTAAYSAKVVLARDPGGRHFMAGNVAAMLSAMAIYVVFVLAVTTAVGADALRGYEGTALAPLAQRVGPVIDVMGTIYVLSTMGLGAMFSARSLFNLTGELVIAAGALGRRIGEAGSLLRFVIRASPVGLIGAGVIALLAANAISLTAVLALIGTLTAPLLGGVFPMLILVASRRRGERVPSAYLRLLGHPVAAGAIGLLFLLGVASFGLWIWTAPLDRAAALAVSAAIVVVTGISIRRGAFRPRTVVEYRIEPGPPQVGLVSVVSAGHEVPATVHLDDGSRARELRGQIAVVDAPRRLRRLGVELPASVARELTVWLHAVTADGESARTGTAIDVSIGEERSIRVDGTVDRLRLASTEEPQTLTLSMSS